MKRNTLLRLTAVLLLVLLMALPISAATAAQPPALRGTLHWDDYDDQAEMRPDHVTVKLYSNGAQIAETQACAADNWGFEFAPENMQNAEYTVSAELPVGYEENSAAHVDPAFHLTEASVGVWTKYEPCNELNIPTSLLSGYVIAGKLTERQTAVIWSSAVLTEVEQDAVLASFRGQPGVGKLSDITFISGDGASERGMTVSAADGVVSFDAHSDWALLFGAEFRPGDCETRDADITLSFVPVLDTPTTPPDDEPLPELPPDPGPETDIEQAPPADPVPEKKGDPQPGKGSAEEPVIKKEPDPEPEPIVRPPLDNEPEKAAEEAENTVTPSSPKPEEEQMPEPTIVALTQSAQPASLDEQPKTGFPLLYTLCEVTAVTSALLLVVLSFISKSKKERR